MLRTLTTCLALFFTLTSLIAQTPLPPSAHGGNPNKTLNLRNPQLSTIQHVLEYDYERQNPRYRALLPKDRICYTNENGEELEIVNPNAVEDDANFEKWIQDNVKRQQSSRSLYRTGSDEILTIPVVVHVIYSNPIENISDEQVLSQIQVLNQDYRRQNPDKSRTPSHFRSYAVDTGIEFCLANVAPNGRATNGINRVSFDGAPFSEQFINEQIKPDVVWDPNRYLNIWVCNIAGGILGYAQFPQSGEVGGLPFSPGLAKTDGVVINYNVFGTIGTVSSPFDGGRTTTHEVGHWLGLRHIWGDGACDKDDYCNDTPVADGPNFNCPPGSVSCEGGKAMVSNYMDYSDDACMNLFTRDQRARMRAVLLNSPRRKSVIESSTCRSQVEPPKPDFIADIRLGCGPLEVNFGDLTEGEVENWRWSFPGGKPKSSKNQNPTVVYKKPGLYEVQLVASNDGGSKEITKSAYIQVMEEGASLPLTATFEPDSVFPPEGFFIHNPQQDHTWDNTERVGGFGKSRGSMTINNYDNNLTGTDDWLVSPIFDLSEENSTTLAFDLAYVPYNGRYTDTLGIFVATACDPVFRCIYYKGGETLQTARPFNKPFSPVEDDWRTDVIDLSQFDGQPRVQIAFVNFGGHGNDIYLDNIKLTGATQLPPVADFKISSTSICAGMDIQFTDDSYGTPQKWVWAFPGGFPAGDTIPNPSVRYEEPGRYDVFLTVTSDGGSNTITRKEVIEVRPKEPVSLTTSKDPNICAGEEITIEVSGANSYTWKVPGLNNQPQNNSLTLRPEQSMTLSVIGEGSSGCKNEVSLSIDVQQGENITLTPPSASICRESNVEINLDGADSYTWEPAQGVSFLGQGLVSLSPDETTTYTVTGIKGSCRVKKDITVTVDDAPNLLTVQSSRRVLCPGDAVTLTASGAAGYRWSPVSDLNNAEGKEVIARPFQSTTYTVTATTENGCSTSADVFVEVIPRPNVFLNASTDLVCEGSTVSLQAAGALTYDWYPQAELSIVQGSRAEAIPTVNTTYQVIGSNEAGCSDTAFVEVDVRESRKVKIEADDAAVCRRQSTVLRAYGASRYTWYPANEVSSRTGEFTRVSPSRQTTYRVVAEDENGCESEDEITIDVATGSYPKAAFTAVKSVVCAGESVQFQSLSQNAQEYYWEFEGGFPRRSNEANPEVTFESEGYHSVSLRVVSCSGNDDYTSETDFIVVTEPIQLSLNQGDQSICKGGSLELQAFGADTYSWSPAIGLDKVNGSIVNAKPTGTTTYKVVGEMRDGCKAEAEITLEVLETNDQLIVSPKNPSICSGESVRLFAEGAASYTWSVAGQAASSGDENEILVSPTQTTTFVVEASSLNGCEFKEEITVTVNEGLAIKIDPESPVICKGDQIRLDTHSEGVFTWSPAGSLSASSGTAVDAFPTRTTEYFVSGTNEGGCHAEARVTVVVNEAEDLKVRAQERSICRGDTTYLTASGSSDYLWSPSESLDKTRGPVVAAFPEETTTYIVSTGADGCRVEEAITVTVTQPEPLTISPASVQACRGQYTTLTASGGQYYIWDQAAGLTKAAGEEVRVNPETTTRYTVRSIDEQGCETSNYVTVVVEEKDFLEISASHSSVCIQEEVSLVASGADTYTWLPADGLLRFEGARTYVRPNQNTTYQVVGTNTGGCVDTAEISLEVNELKPDFVFDRPETIDLAEGPGRVEFSDRTINAESWLWDFGTGSTSTEQNPLHFFRKAGKYTVSLIVSNGICEDIVSKNIEVINSSSLEELVDEGEINIPDLATEEGIINVKLESPRQMRLQLRLLDSRGTQLYDGLLVVSAGTYEQPFSLSNFNKGAYFIELMDGEETYRQQVVYR
ncbi:MAG: PKD domain-containing protein [Bacteroidota bacterium]